MGIEIVLNFFKWETLKNLMNSKLQTLTLGKYVLPFFFLSTLKGSLIL